MRPDLMGELNGVLAMLGSALQWLRAFARIKDEFTVSLGVIVAVGLWVLAVDWAAARDWQAFVLHNILIVGGFIASLLGGMYGTEKMAALAVSRGANPEHPLVPQTDSK